MTPILSDRLAELEAITLKPGGHSAMAFGFCAMEAAAYVAGESWTDQPACVCPVIGAFVRSWNDGLPTDADRDRLLKPLIPRILDTRSTKAVEITRSYLALDWLARVQAPAFLSLRDDLKAHAVALQHCAPLTDPESCAAAQPTLAAAASAAAPAAGDAARAAAWDAARAAAGAAAWDAAWDAARAAAEDAAWDAARAAAWAAAGAALAPTVATLQVSAVDLVLRMVAVQDDAESQRATGR